MSLKTSYTLIAPFYDAAINRATRAARRASLAHLPEQPGQVLVNGVGTGLDLPLLPPQHHYVGLDLTAAMLQRTRPRSGAANGRLDFQPVQGDAHALPFADTSFDHAVLHLILAVVPNPADCLKEVARVVRPGGTVLVFDKFLQPGQPALLRRLLNPAIRHVATRLDVVFEEVLGHAQTLTLESNQPALASGWFRLIRLKKI
ncbi:MAG: phosphatidylethanolamine/phosphatidyl-N-methylethanolamine N-methyltransferase [Pseudomonadota bacterium]|nr:phosphatidylethanolamine/phosphatidyl-N-methylethanolamine N-methyltransferase [Pseudomonadota bacterium]MDQ5917300.1 phosphatidylethanolamine/phosphatidyl-N-methylethanolamine N-methyltransferase [Pseudomonadota bacterium]MDQ5946400.1 phosphatidylethanolamine/phosphatidyl-N-methylethanolamine N-methyltransferase [Pseudomonadota bacterium]